MLSDEVLHLDMAMMDLYTCTGVYISSDIFEDMFGCTERLLMAHTGKAILPKPWISVRGVAWIDAMVR